MYSTTAYLYDQQQTVLMLDTSGSYATARWRPVYSKKLTLNKGTDNTIIFEFINQDQKPVNITDAEFTVNIISQDGVTLLLSKVLTVTNATRGRATLTVTEQELDTIEAQPANYSIERESSSTFDAVFVDDNAGARGTIMIVDSVYPRHISSSYLTIPDQATDSTIRYTSEYSRGTTELQTVAIKPTWFTGSIIIEGTIDGTNYYTIQTLTFTGSNTNTSVNVSGYHKTLRMGIENTSGTVDEIAIR